ncbi:MAG: hypothetical protein H0W62_11255 [Chitinophagales bacterium]|nr:hypothetical protein [Chitinophagales bacterium]
MKISFFILLVILLTVKTKASTVTDISGSYHDGQTFITWTVIPDYKGFYYAYRYNRPITALNIDSAKYMGRVPGNFSLNYFLNLGLQGSGQPTPYLVINNNPTEQLTASQGLFVITCAANGKIYYYAITTDSLNVENRNIVPGANALTTAIAESVDFVQAYLQIADIPLRDNRNLLYNAYAVFGGNVKTDLTPALTNEGCLVYNFGIVKDIDPGSPNAATFFFYGGGGNAYGSCNSVNQPGMWKISMEDDIPNFNWDSISGENTKWIGYNENFDVYSTNDSSAWPTTGINHAYSITRIKWTYDWLLRTFPIDIDLHKIYTQGSSEGTTGALLFGLLYPHVVAAIDVTNAKVNLDYLTDDNPDCKWSEDGGARTKENIFIGDYIHNLPSDVPKYNSTDYYRTYDFGNFSTLLKDNKYNSLPLIFLTSGQSDYVTCWEEKIGFYNSLNASRNGGFYYWDQREHKSGTKEIQDRNLGNFLRYRTDLSYPAFQNCSGDSYPGDTVNPQPPYFDGDTVGTRYGTLDWIDTSIHETAGSWQATVYSHQIELNNGQLYPYNLPPSVRTDITLRRLQQFINIPDNTILCLDNYHDGKLIQTQSINYSTSDPIITFNQIDIFNGTGSQIKVYECISPFKDYTQIHSETQKAAIENIYPNPTFGSAQISFSLKSDMHVILIVKDVLGNKLLIVDEGIKESGDHAISFDIGNFMSGIYVAELHAGNEVIPYKLFRN